MPSPRSLYADHPLAAPPSLPRSGECVSAHTCFHTCLPLLLLSPIRVLRMRASSHLPPPPPPLPHQGAENARQFTLASPSSSLSPIRVLRMRVSSRRLRTRSSRCSAAARATSWRTRPPSTSSRHQRSNGPSGALSFRSPPSPCPPQVFELNYITFTISHLNTPSHPSTLRCCPTTSLRSR